MKIVYEVTHDHQYQHLMPDNVEDVSKLNDLVCKPRLDTWKPIVMYNPVPTLEETDFYQIFGGHFIINEKANKSFGMLFRNLGEVLPLICSEIYCPDGNIYIVNLLECINCLDHDKTTWKIKHKLISKPIFKESRLPPAENGFFKIPETRSTMIYALVDTELPDETSIINRINSAGLKGLVFTEVWHSE